MTYWKSPSFKAMQRAWYDKLAEEGFQDAEELISGEMVLRQIAAHPYRGQDELSISTKEDYYRILGQKLEEASFKNDVDRMILSFFAIGTKIQRIIEILQREGKTRCRGTIRFTIRKYEMKWGLRAYTPKQLNRQGPRRRLTG